MAKQRPEIDKEAMYRKIMPSSYQPARSSASAEHPGEVKEPLCSSAEIREDSVAPSQGVQITKNGSHVLVNVMEHVVVEKLDLAFSRFNNCCKCDKCRKDVAAIALNKLTPKYVVAEKGQLPEQISKINSSEVLNAIVQAIIQVRSHPRH